MTDLAGRKPRGFQTMSPERRREIARRGGKAAHASGTAHEWTSEEARAAGRKGGKNSRGGRGRTTGGERAPEGVAESQTPVPAGQA